MNALAQNLLLTHLVTARYLKTSFISLDFDKDDVEAQLDKGLRQVNDALVTAHRAISELPKFEHEAKELHDRAAKGLQALKTAVAAVPHKEAPTLAAEIDKDIQVILGQNWTAALTSDSGFTQFLIRTFDKMKKAFSRIKSKPEVVTLSKLVADLGPVHKELMDLQKKFEDEFEGYGHAIVKDIEFEEIFEPAKHGGWGESLGVPNTGNHDKYNNLHYSVKSDATHILLYANKMQPKLRGMMLSLQAMHDHLVETKKAVHEYLYKKDHSESQ